MDGQQGAAPQAIPRGLSKSNSNASARAGSVKSHNSVKVIGAHPLGTLRVHEAAADTPVHHEADADDDDDEGPPPLLDAQQTSQGLVVTGTVDTFPSPPRDRLSHGMGGGDVVLILDLPEVFTVGYDAVSFTAKHFGGVRDIPPGAHFFWVAHPGGLSTRSGFWFVSNGADHAHVMQWDRYNEVLDESTRAEARTQCDNLDAIHSKLVPYRDPSAVNDKSAAAKGDLLPSASERNLNIWAQLTTHVTEKVLRRVTGEQLDGWTVHTADRVKGAILIAAEMELDRRVSGSALLQARELNFTFTQHSKTYTTSHIGADRTLEATDATPYMLSLVNDAHNDLSADDIVGEFQFAYIVGMHLGNDSCIQQWWHMLLKLILRAYILPARHPVLAAALIRTLAAQLSYGTEWLDGSILDYSLSQTDDLRLALTVYKRRLDELLVGADATPDQLAVGTAFSGLEATVAGSLDWDIRGNYLRKGNVMMEDGEQVELEVADLAAEDERGEWAPEVVQLDESGRQRDLVSWSD